MSSKRETHRQAVRPLLAAALQSPGLIPPAEFNMARYSFSGSARRHLLDPDIAALEDYLLDHSGLPGPRANLALIDALADEVGALCAAPDVPLNVSYITLEWLLWQLLNRYTPAQFGADPDSPLQMPQLCGLVAYGEWAVAFRHLEKGVATLLEAANSPLWRVREGAALGLQRMLREHWPGVFRRLTRSALDARAYEWRALVAGVAEPDLLADRAHALDALDLVYGALVYLRRLPAEARRADAPRALRRALGYAVSVVVAAVPETGFAQMEAWAGWGDPDVAWVLRENLKKKCLGKWPQALGRVAAVLASE